MARLKEAGTEAAQLDAAGLDNAWNRDQFALYRGIAASDPEAQAQSAIVARMDFTRACPRPGAIVGYFSRSQITITRTTLLLAGMRHRRASMKSRSPSLDEAGLLAPDPAFVPGGIDLGDHLAVLNPVTAGISDHGAQRLCAVFIGLRNDPAPSAVTSASQIPSAVAIWRPRGCSP